MKIYIITKGEYSDYHICAATTDENIAKKLLRLYSDGWDEPQMKHMMTGQRETFCTAVLFGMC